ncbi:MAG: pteridine reductase [Nevskiaceae bacterium]|nr:MAG: pteridine reductase [Nevskiaceae bacterium]
MTTDKVALVTGAARRIGAAIARELHAAGWRVLVHYRGSAAEAQALVAELTATRPDTALALPADLADAAALATLARQAQAHWGRLDALVNNASVYYPTPFGAIASAQFDDLLASNLRAPLLLTQACAPLLADGGAVVNIVDTLARRPARDFSAYHAAKSGLWTLTEALALELAPRVRVNGVAPGHMLWPEYAELGADRQRQELARVPLGRLGGAQEIARAVKFLLSDDAAYITGAVLPVDGGLRLR